MKQHDDNLSALGVLRELPPEVSLEQVNQMVALFPIATGAAAGLLYLIKQNLSTMLMTTTAGSIIVGGSLYLFSAADPAPANSAVEAAAPITIEAPAINEVIEEPAMVLHIEAKRDEKPALVQPAEPNRAPAVIAASPDAGTVSNEAPGPLATVVDSAPTDENEATPFRVLRKNEGERSFDLSGFSGVSLHASVDVIVEQGPFSVRAHGEADALERLQVSVKNGVLLIDQERTRYLPGNCNTAVVMKVRMPSMTNLEVLGSGNMKASQFNGGGPMDLVVRGSGDLIVEGMRTATALNVAVHGSGDLVVNGIREAASLRIKVEGSGDVVCTGVAVSGMTVIDLAGSGDVRVSGSTDRLEATVTGSGDVMAQEMRANTVKARVVGSGDVSVRSDGRVEREVIGSGDVHVLGSAGGNRPRGVGDRSQ
ncbi:MAG: DUF2807 domain-containing protein [Flavobacteriales bacterium]|nr:DUF2807 domain-containing protein [Flavobacteriales bacterium]